MIVKAGYDKDLGKAFLERIGNPFRDLERSCVDR